MGQHGETGEEIKFWGPLEPEEIHAGADEWPSCGGLKRRFYEEIETEEPREDRGVKASGSATAGSSRRAGAKSPRSEETEEEKRIRGWQKGKGWGGQKLPQEKKKRQEEKEREKDEERKRKEEKESRRRQRRLFEFGFRKQQGERFRELNIEQFVGSASEEEPRGAGSCSSNVGETCQGNTGSISTGGHRREQRHHQGSEAELVLFPDAEAVLLNSRPGYERALPSGELCGPTSLRTVRPSWRQPGIEVFGDPLRHGGGHLEECPIPRVEPAGCPEQRSNTGPLGSEADLQKVRTTMVSEDGTSGTGKERRTPKRGKEKEKGRKEKENGGQETPVAIGVTGKEAPGGMQTGTKRMAKMGKTLEEKERKRSK